MITKNKIKGPKRSFYHLRDQSDTNNIVKGLKEHFSLFLLSFVKLLWTSRLNFAMGRVMDLAYLIS